MTNGRAAALEPLTVTIPRLLTPAQAAKAIGCSRQNVLKLIAKGALRAVDVAAEASSFKRWVIPASELLDFLVANGLVLPNRSVVAKSATLHVEAARSHGAD